MIYSIWFKLGLWFQDKIWQLAEWFLEGLLTLLQVITWLIDKFFWLQILWEERQKRRIKEAGEDQCLYY